MLLVISFLVSNSHWQLSLALYTPCLFGWKSIGVGHCEVVFLRFQADGGGLYKYSCSIELHDHDRSIGVGVDQGGGMAGRNEARRDGGSPDY